ncbi:restriction endonuclease subunit S [Mariniflexile sp. HNIBRBA6329]|uniref:restriction endonuclease subunit S n=1 Tax=Mariniflexile sp. HNIBRBA6329 TaxID=3373088 RepID=UPI0037476CB9
MNGNINTWKELKIEDLGKVVSGGTPKTNNPNFWDGDINWVTPTDVTSLNGKKYIYSTKRKISIEGLKNSSANMLPVGTLIVCTRATIGASVVNKVPISTNQGFKSLITKPEVSSEYMYYWMSNNKNELIKQSSGSTFLELSTTSFKSLSVLLPSLPEQQKIADILSTVDAKIEVIDQQISETQELKKGLMQRLLTKGIGHTQFKDSPLGKIPVSWEVVKLEQLGDFFKGKGISKAEILENGQYPCIRYGEIYTIYDTVIKKFQSFINEESANNSFQFNSGDLLFTGSGETIEDIGKCVTYIGSQKAFASGDIIIHRPEKGDSRYLSYYMNSQIIRSQTKKMGQGNSVVHIYVKHLSQLVLSFPPIIEQERIAKILGSVDDKLEVLEEKKTHYQELKQGLMQQLLTGNIRVKTEVGV